MQWHWVRFSSVSLLAVVGGWSILAWASNAAEQDQARKTLGQGSRLGTEKIAR